MAVLVLILQGCASMLPPPQAETVEQRLDRAVATQDYREAMALLDELEAEHSTPLLDRRDTIEAAASEKVAISLAIAEQAARVGYLGLAVTILERARVSLPDDALLDYRIETLSTSRTAAMDTLEVEYLRLEADHLLRQRKLVENMSQLVKDPLDLPRQLEQIEQDAIELAASLDASAARRDDPAERLALLRLAEALEPCEQRQSALAAFEPPPTVSNGPPNGLPHAIANLRRALQRNDLHAAQQICRDPAWRGTDDRMLEGLCTVFDQHRAAWLEKGLEDGRRLYATGQIEAAIERWREGQRLEPEHTGLNAALERAQRVEERLQSLRERAVQENTPKTATETTPDAGATQPQ